jgi:hypothetical protein
MDSSYYKITASVPNGGWNREEIWLVNSFEALCELLQEDPVSELEFLIFGQTFQLEVIQNGQIIKDIDLHPYVQLQIENQEQIHEFANDNNGNWKLDESIEQSLFEDDELTTDITLSFNPSLKEQLPSLQGHLLAEDDKIIIDEEECVLGRNHLS